MNLGDHVCLSGGADGADLQFGMCAGLVDHTVIHWTFFGHRSQAPSSEIVRLTDEQLRRADPMLERACDGLKRRFPPRSIFVANLLRRNWYQVETAERVYAVASIDKYGIVSGGTAWAVQMFIDRFNDVGEIPVWVFDQKTDQWSQRIDGSWIPAIPPEPSGVYAGVGSRDLLVNGKTAIRRLFGVEEAVAAIRHSFK